MIIKFNVTLSFIFCSVFSFASSLTPLPLSYGALLYDVILSGGPGSSATIEPGHWVPELTTFNSGALVQNKITRLYPYSSDIEITCSNSNDITTCLIDPGYATGSASVLAYHNAFNNAVILPIVDASFNYLQNKLLKTNTALADNVAQALVTQICNDANADGVFFDLETSGGYNNPGIYELYQQVSKLFAKSPCVDATHPKGRFMGIYVTPVGDDWATAQKMLAGTNNSFLAIPLYDVKGFSDPPTPDPLSTYNGYVTSALQHASTNGQQYKVSYTIIVPAGASFGTFQEYGSYNPSEPAPTYFQLITDYSQTNAKQVAFVQNARNVACVNQNPYFMGMDYWSWQQYIHPDTGGSNSLVMPNIPDSEVVSYLQQSASCQ